MGGGDYSPPVELLNTRYALVNRQSDNRKDGACETPARRRRKRRGRRRRTRRRRLRRSRSRSRSRSRRRRRRFTKRRATKCDK